MQTNYEEMFMSTRTETPKERNEKEHEFKRLFGKSFSNYITNSNIKIETISKLTGYDIQHFYGISSGKKAPSLFCLYRICKSLDVTPEFLWNFGNEFNESDNEIDAKRALLLNKISSIEEESILDKLIYEADFFSGLKSKRNNGDFEY